MVRRTTRVATVLAVVAAGLAVVGLSDPAGAGVPHTMRPGDLVVADTNHGRVLVVPADGAEDPWVFARGLTDPVDVAVAPDGTVWVSDNQDLVVYEYAPDGTLEDTNTDAQDPWGVAVAPDGDLIVTDSAAGVVRRYTSQGVQEITGLTYPSDAVVAPNGDLLVTGDSGLARFDRDGDPITNGADAGLGDTSSVFVAVTADGVPVVSWRSLDQVVLGGDPVVHVEGPDALLTPTGVAVEPDGDLVVADSGNSRILRGAPGDLSEVDLGSETVDHPFGLAIVPPLAQPAQPGDVYAADPQHGTVLHLPADGGPPSTVGQGLRAPESVAVDPEGNVYIADLPEHLGDPDSPEGRLVKVSADGLTQTTLADDLYDPWDVAVDADHVYVSDFTTGGSVSVMDHDGGDREQLATGAVAPAGIALDPLGNLFVADPYSFQGDNGTHSLIKVPASGEPVALDAEFGILDLWNVATTASGDLYTGGAFVDQVSRLVDGAGDPVPAGGVGASYGIAVDAQGNVLVADPAVGQIDRFAPDGATLDPLGSAEFALGEVIDPRYPDDLTYRGPYDVAVYAPAAQIDATTAPGTAAVGAPYAGHTWTADGDGDTTFSLADGDLPPGLSLSERGVLSGTPTSTGTFSFRIQTGNAATATVGAESTIVVAKGAQTIAFTTDPGSAHVGGSYHVAATGGGSTAPVTFSIAPASADVCSIEGSTVHFSAVGSCVVRADQAGDDGYLAAAPRTQTIEVGLSGQAVWFTSTPPAAPVVGQTYSPSATSAPYGPPITITSSGACSTTGGTVRFEHVGTCTVTATLPQDAEHQATQATQTLVVVQAATDVVAGVSAHALTATVSVVAPGAGVPGGEVAFRVDGDLVGAAPLDAAGLATLGHDLAPGEDHTVVATYGGDDDFAGSSDSVERGDPAITASVTSEKPKRHGWYRAPVTVRFTCTPTTAALVRACPAPVVIKRNQNGSRSILRSVVAADGGRGDVVVTGIKVDRTRPRLAVRGAMDGATYGAVRALRCVAHDRHSGVDSCQVTAHRTAHRVVYRAVAVDLAGNRTVVRGHYLLR